MEAERSTQDSLGKRKRLDADEDEEEVKTVINEESINISSDEEGSGADESDDSDDEVEVEEEDGGGITAECEYFEDGEPFPECAVYDKDFTQVGTDLTSISKTAIDIIDLSQCDNKRVQSCRNNATELSILPRSKREKIALLGKTGAGKSSLLNCLLGLPNMAKAMAGGQSCTYIGTEYERPFQGQTKKLAAKVEYFDIEAIMELLDRLIKDYNSWTFEQQEDWSEDEKQELKRLMLTAFTTFRSLFCDRIEFESPRAAEDFLRDSYHGSGEDALASFGEWCEELLEEKEADEDDHIEYLDADTQNELLAQLNPLVSGTSRFEAPALWPLVRKVRIGIEGPRILEYIVLVDLPGLDDTNQIRVNTSYDTMRSCDTIWVVTKIARAITDTTVDYLLMRYGRSFKMVVICTGTDENIDPGLATHLESEGQSIGDHWTLLGREKHLRKLLKRLPKNIKTREMKLDGRGKRRGSKKQKPLTEKAKINFNMKIAQLEAEQKSAEEDLPGVAQERFELLVDARNSNTIRRLQIEKDGHLAHGETLEVFCVSNLHYDALKGARVINGPRLSAKMTGVPGLRSYILESASPVILQTMEDYINHKFTVFMKGLAMWAKAHSIEGSEKLLEAVRAPQDEVRRFMLAYHDKLMETVEEINIRPLADAQSELISSAVNHVNVKKQWAWSTMRAFIRKDGNHKTSVAPQQSWNEQFLEGANKIFREQWEEFNKKQTELGAELKAHLLSLILDLAETIKGDPASMVLPMDRLYEIFEAQGIGIEQACVKHQHGFKKELRNIKIDLMQDRHTGYFSQAMKEAYTKCKEDFGKSFHLEVMLLR